MLSKIRVWILLPILLVSFHISITGQTIDFDRYKNNIFLFLEETDLPIQDIMAFADEYFKIHGTAKGSGYKHYQRWLYERKFHLDQNGYLIPPASEFRAYEDFVKRNPNSNTRTAGPWTDQGPTAWVNSGSWNPGVGRITSVAVQVGNANNMYVSSPGGGIWKTTNGGTVWTPLMDGVNSSWMYIYNVTIDPLSTSTLYAAVMGGGVIKSTNSGTTWAATGAGPSTTRKVVVNPTNSNIVFATSASGIYRSINGGTSWTQVSTFNSEDIEFKPGTANTMYASGVSNSLRRSTDNGVTWSIIGSGQGITNSGRTLLGVSANDPTVVYAVQANDNVFGRMYKSVDSGQTFTTTIIGNPANGTNFFGYSSLGDDVIGQAGYDMAICVNPTNVNEVHIAGIICWKSTNGGTSFVPETEWFYPNGTGYNHADVHALEWVGTVIYSGSDGGVYKSTNNGGDWTDITNGLSIRQIYRMSNSKTNANVITTGSQDNGSSYRQLPGQWIEWLGADGMDNMISPTNANFAYGTSQFGDIYKTTTGGSSYTGLTKPADGNWITPLAMHPTNHAIIYGGWLGVYKSTNSGASWTNISAGFINRKLDVLAVSASNTNFIYASWNNILFRTQNGGTSWDSIATTQAVSSIFISATDPLKIWVTLNTGSSQVLYSVNGGTAFENISAGLPAISARTVVVDEAAVNGVYVGMNLGVYYRNDFNPAWVLYGNTLPLVAINELEIQASTGKLRVATYGRGVWENTIETPSCQSKVVNTLDTGLGSLRSAIGCITGSDTITFTPAVIGPYIDLTTGNIVIDRTIKILQSPTTIPKIRTLNNGPIFNINVGKTVTLRYVDFYGGTNATARAILNKGNLFLFNVNLFDNASGDGTLIQNNGLLNIDGTVQVKN